LIAETRTQKEVAFPGPEGGGSPKQRGHSEPEGGCLQKLKVKACFRGITVGGGKNGKRPLEIQISRKKKGGERGKKKKSSPAIGKKR